MNFVKRWLPVLITVLVCITVVLLRANRSAYLLADTDTAVTLEKIAERSSPLSWFWTDWPLENHFYRPISTLVYELDHALYGNNATGFGLTNALLVALCVCGVAWLAREATHSVPLSALATSIFTVHVLSSGSHIASAAWIIAGVCAGLIVLPKRRLWPIVAAVCLWAVVAHELVGAEDLAGRMLDWIPGRTASTMAVFALPCLALGMRWAMLERAIPAPTPLDPPATKSSVQESPRQLTYSPRPRLFLGVFLLALLSMLSYEQAITLVLIGFISYVVLTRFKITTFIAILPIGAALISYIGLRSLSVSIEPSGYQEQQFRLTVAALHSIGQFSIPGVLGGIGPWETALTGPEILLTVDPWIPVMLVTGWLVALSKMSKTKPMALMFFLCSIAAFLPMAFLKPFEHYWFFPMALRAVFIALLIEIAVEQTLSAARRPEIQAPPRLHPAPGSLPHL